MKRVDSEEPVFSGPEAPSQSKTILFIDDDDNEGKIIQEIIKARMPGLGYASVQLIAVQSIEEAEEILTNSGIKIDLVVCDFMFYEGANLEATLWDLVSFMNRKGIRIPVVPHSAYAFGPIRTPTNVKVFPPLSKNLEPEKLAQALGFCLEEAEKYKAG